MELKIKSMLAVAMMTAVAFSAASCSDDDDDNNGSSTESEMKELCAKANADFVNNTVIPTYTGLMNANEDLLDAIEDPQSQSDIDKACEAWKTARQYWEWSEAFLFGAASNYGIDPHTDTWPFDTTKFDQYMSKYDPSNDETDAAIVEEAIVTGQNFTGFHAVEYLLFRNGQPRKIEDITDNELWFCQTAANDLYLNSIKLVAAWGGELDEDQEDALEEAEMEPEDDFGDELTNAGKAGSRWKTELAGVQQIISGCTNILDEVANAKIGAPHSGEDESYIESPHAYNSVQDFTDNTLSCQYAIYGKLGATSAQPNSVMSIAKSKCPIEAEAVESALANAVAKVKAIKTPFVIYYKDASAQTAIDALQAFSKALGEMSDALAK